ncbi:MAG: peptidase MA family metallohydrolase [Candidatus Omnitrophota bacterium]
MKTTIIALACYLTLCSFVFSEDFSEKKSDHFIVYYKDVPAEFVGTIIDYSERYYNELTEKLGFTRYDYWTWDKRAKIYVYPDQETYLKETRQPSWSSGAAAYDQKTIWTFPRESGFFDSLLPHELGHIIFREVIGGRDVPLWLEEGVASYLEQAKRFGSDKIVLDAIDNKSFIPLKELTQIDAFALRQRPDINLFYAESVNIISYLIDKFGSEAFNDFCKKLKDRKSLDDALAYAYFDIRSLSQLAEMWEASLKDKARSKSKMIL